MTAKTFWLCQVPLWFKFGFPNFIQRCSFFWKRSNLNKPSMALTFGSRSKPASRLILRTCFSSPPYFSQNFEQVTRFEIQFRMFWWFLKGHRKLFEAYLQESNPCPLVDKSDAPQPESPLNLNVSSIENSINRNGHIFFLTPFLSIFSPSKQILINQNFSIRRKN